MVDFDFLKRTAYAWQIEARELICAANILLTSYESYLKGNSPGSLTSVPNEGCLWRPMMVLYSFAVENLLKAIIIARKDDPAPGGKLEGWFKHHNLEVHANRAKLSFTPQSGLFKTLQDFIESGKYPIGKDIHSGGRSNQFIYPTYIDDMFGLFENLENELRTILPSKSLPKTDLRNICCSNRISGP